MKAEHISIALKLEQIPNIGNKTARLLKDIGVSSPSDLLDADCYYLYDKICQVTQQTHDPRLLDILLSALHFVEGNAPKHWSEFTPQRKEILEQVRLNRV